MGYFKAILASVFFFKLERHYVKERLITFLVVVNTLQFV
jgi:hypothetical protein